MRCGVPGLGRSARPGRTCEPPHSTYDPVRERTRGCGGGAGGEPPLHRRPRTPGVRRCDRGGRGRRLPPTQFQTHLAERSPLIRRSALLDKTSSNFVGAPRCGPDTRALRRSRRVRGRITLVGVRRNELGTEGLRGMGRSRAARRRRDGAGQRRPLALGMPAARRAGAPSTRAWKPSSAPWGKEKGPALRPAPRMVIATAVSYGPLVRRHSRRRWSDLARDLRDGRVRHSHPEVRSPWGWRPEPGPVSPSAPEQLPDGSHTSSLCQADTDASSLRLCAAPVKAAMSRSGCDAGPGGG
jgi:hypothetical protein